MAAASSPDAHPLSRAVEQRADLAAAAQRAGGSDEGHGELAVRELGRRSLAGTAGHVMALVFLEIELADLPSFPALTVLAVFFGFLVLRVAAYMATARVRGSLRVRWLLLALGAIGLNVVWGVMITAVQLETGASKDSLVMAFLMCGVAAGGVTAFAPSRWIQISSLAVMALPVVVLGAAGLGTSAFAVMHGMLFAFMVVLGRGSHRDFWQAVHGQALLRGHAESAQRAAIAADATAQQLRTEIAYRSAVEIELRQAQKLEAIGRLAAGIAHEINTPIQFVSDSCRFLGDGVVALGATVDGYRGLMTGVTIDDHARAAARALEDDHDVDYLLANLPEAIARALDGLDRVAKIVAATKEFSYPYLKEKSLADVNQAIRSTLVISNNETKYVATVHAELGELPMVLCHCGELNQVVLNLIVNAAHAIGDVVQVTGVPGAIRIKTWAEAGVVRISVSDSGPGIAPEIIDKIFEPFFTTKPVGSGSGQGLAIARSVVVDKHGGTLDVVSELGVGTTFTIGLPIGGASAVDGARPASTAAA